MKQWSYSAYLLVGYLLIFHLWGGAERAFVVSSGVLWCLVFGVWLVVEIKAGYFVNRLDWILHCVVIVDVLLEALLLEEHDHLGFWLCGMGFGVVIGVYRYLAARQRRRMSEGEIRPE